MMGLYLDELRDGLEFDLGSHLFTREAVLRYARRYDPQPFHTDDEAAAASHFGRLAASGWHTAAAWMRCFVTANDRHRALREASGESAARLGPSPGVNNLKWIKPVYPGDTITFTLRITGARPLNSRPGWGLVSKYTEGINQDGDRVFSFDGKVLSEARG